MHYRPEGLGVLSTQAAPFEVVAAGGAAPRAPCDTYDPSDPFPPADDPSDPDGDYTAFTSALREYLTTRGRHDGGAEPFALVAGVDFSAGVSDGGSGESTASEDGGEGPGLLGHVVASACARGDGTDGGVDLSGIHSDNPPTPPEEKDEDKDGHGGGAAAAEGGGPEEAADAEGLLGHVVLLGLTLGGGTAEQRPGSPFEQGPDGEGPAAAGLLSHVVAAPASGGGGGGGRQTPAPPEEDDDSRAYVFVGGADPGPPARPQAAAQSRPRRNL